MQFGLRQDLSEATLELTAGVTRIGNNIVPVKKEDQLAFCSVEIKEG